MAERPEEPPPGLRRRDTRHDTSDSEDAHELQEIRSQYDRNSQTVQRSISRASSRRQQNTSKGLYWLWNEMMDFWRRHIVIVVDQVDTRDHLANERTYLSYLKTSQAIALLGVIIAQIFRIQPSDSSDPDFGYYVVGQPMAAVCFGAAIIVSLLGTCRWYRNQRAIIQGKALTGGFEITTVWMGTLAVLIALFVLAIAIAIRRDAT